MRHRHLTIAGGLSAAVLVLAIVRPIAAQPAEPRPWFARSLVGMEVGPTGAQFGHSDPTDRRYAARFDGREIVRQCVEAGAQYVVMWARDGDFAYYNSALLPKPPGLGDRDPLREAVDEAHVRGIPLIAYCVVQQGGNYLDQHPEFAMRDAEGKPIGRFCYNSGYLDVMKSILAEQLAYGIDGFHVDMLDQGFGPPYGCWCDACVKLFREMTNGHEPPREPTWDIPWDAFLSLRYRSSQQFEIALRDHVKAINPNASIDFNYHGNPPFSWEVGQRPAQHARNGDFVTGETGIWGFSALGVGLNAEFYRAAFPGHPFQVAMQRGVRMYHDQTTRPVPDMQWELFTLLAHGAFVTMVDKTAFDGALDPVAYRRMGQAYRPALALQAEFGFKPVADVGIYFSDITRDRVGREHPETYFRGFQGAHKALVYEHIPYGVILSDNTDGNTFARYPVVLLPNVEILSLTEEAWLADYAAGGGHVIVTGATGLAGGFGELRTQSQGLQDLIGAKAGRRLETRDNWVSFSAADIERLHAPLGGDIDAGWPFLVEGTAVVYEPTTATPLGSLFAPARTTRQKEGKEGTEWPMSAGEPVGPAVLINNVGKGTVITFACSPDQATGGEHPIVEARKLLAAVVRALHPEPRLRLDFPANVEAVVTDDPEHRLLRVFLIGYNPTPQSTPPKNRPYVIPGLVEDAASFSGSIVTRPAGEATIVGTGTSVVRARDDRLIVTVGEGVAVVKIPY